MIGFDEKAQKEQRKVSSKKCNSLSLRKSKVKAVALLTGNFHVGCHIGYKDKTCRYRQVLLYL